MMKYFFVNQETYLKEKQESCIWAPKISRNGKEIWHWNTLCDIAIGDVVFHNYKSRIVAISIAVSRAYSSPKPASLESNSATWLSDGRRVDLTYYELTTPLDFQQFQRQIDLYRTDKYYSFTLNYQATQTYLTSLPDGLAKFFLSQVSRSDFDKIFEMLERLDVENDESMERHLLQNIYCKKIAAYTDEQLLEKENELFVYDETTDRVSNHSRARTNPRLLATRLKKANYKCEVDFNHVTFPSVDESHMYMECHHIIPMNAQKDFPYKNLDGLYNLISVCPTCHAQMHYASLASKKEMFEKMISVRKQELLEHGFTEDELQDIFDCYYT